MKKSSILPSIMNDSLFHCNTCNQMTNHTPWLADFHTEWMGWYRCLKCSTLVLPSDYGFIEGNKNVTIYLPICPICGKRWVREKRESSKLHIVYKPDCNCLKKKLRLSIG